MSNRHHVGSLSLEVETSVKGSNQSEALGESPVSASEEMDESDSTLNSESEQSTSAVNSPSLQKPTKALSDE